MLTSSLFAGDFVATETGKILSFVNGLSLATELVHLSRHLSVDGKWDVTLPTKC